MKTLPITELAICVFAILAVGELPNAKIQTVPSQWEKYIYKTWIFSPELDMSKSGLSSSWMTGECKNARRETFICPASLISFDNWFEDTANERTYTSLIHMWQFGGVCVLFILLENTPIGKIKCPAMREKVLLNVMLPHSLYFKQSTWILVYPRKWKRELYMYKPKCQWWFYVCFIPGTS